MGGRADADSAAGWPAQRAARHCFGSSAPHRTRPADWASWILTPPTKLPGDHRTALAQITAAARN